MSYTNTMTTDAAFARYEAVRNRLPQAQFPDHSTHLNSLSEVANHIDAFILDAFGVLNVGTTPIPGAVARMAELRERGKKLIVLTNAASDPRSHALQKYQTLGFDFTAEEIVASRDVCAKRLRVHLPDGLWGAISTNSDDYSDMDAKITRWNAETRPDVDGFLLLSSADLDAATVSALSEAMTEKPRPMIVANPDIVAPRETGLSREPGFFAHQIADETGAAPVFFGKPFGDAYEDVLANLPDIPRDRIAMVGDTLHTDVLGGAAAGLKTVLITDYGLFANMPVEGFIERSGIRPDFICKTT